jgi:2-C-methyl-D-erythritol 4-phosphate cytidylyltransferase
MEDYEPLEPGEAFGVVVEAGRGSLPFALLHGEPLVACAAWAVGEAGIQLVDATTPWEAVQEAGVPLAWHDALCPMTPPGFLAECVRRVLAGGRSVAAVLTVTDTVKVVHPGAGGPVVGETLDRDHLRRLASPLVLAPGTVAELDDWPPVDFREALEALRRVGPVDLVEAPASARRVTDVHDLPLLEAVTRT